MPTAGRPDTEHRRLVSIDLLRGLVMAFMLLDHTRDFVHRDGLTQDPTDPSSTTLTLYFTRWITHFCAPTFVLLAGLSARIQLERGADRRGLSTFLVRRGLILVALELVVLRPLIWFNLDYAFLAHLQVIWVIGLSMVLLGAALLARASGSLLGWIGLAVILAHNLLPHRRFGFADLFTWDGLGLILHVKGGLQVAGEGSPIAFVQYPLVPWFAVLFLGFGLGGLYSTSSTERARRLLTLGTAAVLLFVLLRAFRLHGDPAPWDLEQPGLQSLYSFLRVEKYPPSLHFLAMTLGPALIALALFERVNPTGIVRALTTVGRVPLFFYVLQWPLVHLVSRLFQWIAGQPMGWDAPNPLTLEGDLPPGCGFGLGVVYLGFALGLAVLVPLALWFARWKSAHPEWRWLRYF